MKNNYIYRIVSTPKLLAICLVFTLGIGSVVGQTSKTFVTSGTFTVPASVYSIQVQCWGGGGGGGSARATNGGSGGGGGGGAYKIATIAVIPGQVISYTVGAGGVGGSSSNATIGGATTFSTTVTAVTANGGSPGGNNTSTTLKGAGGAGGTGGTYNGGAGAPGQTGAGGGGGSSAGTGSNGNTATTNTGATAVTGGGAGGSGASNTTGRAGAAPGGGGAGGSKNNTNTNGGAGGTGQIVINYYVTYDPNPTIVIGYKSGIPQTNGNTNESHTLNSSFQASMIDKLTNASNFGPIGKSPFIFQIVDLGNTPITKALLIANNIDILHLGISDGDAWSGTLVDSYTTSEISEIKSWTNETQTRVVLAFQGYAAALGGTGYAAATGNVGLNNVTTLGKSILNGPFADFTPFNQSGGYTGVFTKTPSSSCVLTEDSSTPTKKSTGLVDNISGDIYLADVGLLEKAAGLTDGSLISSSTDEFCANIYHGLAQIVSNKPLSVCQFFDCPSGINGPTLSAASINVKCPATTTNLNSLIVGSSPAGSVLKWFTTPDHTTGTEYTTPETATAGTYYAFYYTGGGDNCYSPPTKVVVEQGISISTNYLNEFSYVFGSGPSATQTLIVSGACLTNPIDITLTANSKYEISVDGINWQTTTLTLPLTTPAPNGIVENTNIYVRLISGLAVGLYNGSSITLTSTGATTKIVNLTGRVTDYCTTTGNTDEQTSITLVKFNTINNITRKSNPSYTDYTSTISTDLNPNQTYSLTVNLNTDGNYTVNCKVWIDWNHDGDFSENGEDYDLGNATFVSNGKTSASPYNITVPIGAAVGNTVMRVSCSYYPNELDPCATIRYGEIEDYTLNILKNYWQGNTSEDWNTGSNWTAGVVPADGADVEYSTGTPYPAAANDLKLDQDRTIGNLINATTKKLIIPTGLSLKVNGSIQTGGFDDRIVIKTRTASPSVPNGSLIFPNAYGVHATVEMYSRAYKGPVVTLPDETSYSYNWQFFGIPLTQVTADPTFAGSYVRIYNESQPGERTKWTQLTNSSILYPFKGYEITQKDSTTIYFRGELVNRSTTISLPYTTTTGVFEQGQHILSNPYTAAIDVRKLIFGSDTERTVYLYTTGSFANWYNSGGGTTYDDTSASAGQYLAIPQRVAGIEDGLTNDIPSMSSFLVKATDTSGAKPGSVTINYGSVVFKNAHPQRVKSTPSANLSATDLVSTKIDLIGQHYSDRMWIFTEPSCTKNFDNGWDGRKILGSSLAPQIFAVEPDGDYQVNSVDDMHNTDIAFQPGDEVEYTMKFTNENIKRKYAGVYLVDLVENKTVDVTESGSTYQFATAPASEPNKRFKIITRYYEKNAPDIESSVKIFTARNTVFIQNLSASSGECTLYDILGRAIIKKTYGPNSVTEVGVNLTQGAYVTTAITNGEKVSKRVIVQ
jgi:hypothetical protein